MSSTRQIENLELLMFVDTKTLKILSDARETGLYSDSDIAKKVRTVRERMGLNQNRLENLKAKVKNGKS